MQLRDTYATAESRPLRDAFAERTDLAFKYDATGNRDLACQRKRIQHSGSNSSASSINARSSTWWFNQIDFTSNANDAAVVKRNVAAAETKHAKIRKAADVGAGD